MKRQNGEMLVVLELLKNLKKEYNITGLAKEISLSPMGVLKILKKLENQEIVNLKKIGKSSVYNINWKNGETEDLVLVLLKNEIRNASPYLKRWGNEVKKINESEISIIFGSVLELEEKSQDIDVLFVVKKGKFDKLKEKINQVNKINEKEIHPIYQTLEDMKKNINKEDKIILGAIKGVIVLGHEKFIELIKKEEKWA